MIGRPKEFDEADVLQQAMEVFWAHGYEATSVQDLLDAMGINRASMYDTFGDKHALFMAAFEHYGRTVTRGVEEVLDGPGSPLANIRKVLTRMAGDVVGGRSRGCLACNTAVELAPHDSEVAGAVGSSVSVPTPSCRWIQSLGYSCMPPKTLDLTTGTY